MLNSNARIAVVIFCLVIGIAASLFYGNAILKVGPTYPYNSPNAPYSSLQYAVTVTCYLDGCPPVACPSWGCGTMTTTTVSAYLHSTQAVQTFVGYVKILTGAPSGVYFFDVGSVQYHLVFCNCPATEVCNCPNIPVLSDGQRLQVIGTIVTPSTYGSVWAPGGDIYVQSWALA